MSNTLVLEEASSLPIPTGERPPPTKSPGLEALLAMAQASDFADIERAAGEGATVVWGFIMGWNPLFRALNVISGEMGLIADSIKFSADAVSVAESYFQIPVETCTPVKARAGLHHMRRKTTNIKRHVQFAGDCGMSDVMSELLRKEGLEVYAVEPISPFKFDPTRRDEFVRFYVDEIQRLSHWLVGKPVDETILAAELKTRNVVARKLDRILELRLRNPFHVSLADVFLLGGGSFDYFAHDTNYFENRRKYIAILDQLIEELENVPEADDFVPLLKVGGCPFCGELCRVVDEANGAIVGNNMLEPALYREDVSPVESLAHFMLDQQIEGRGEDKSGGSFTATAHHISQQLRKTNARGVIVTGVTNCPYTSIAQQYWHDYFKKQNIPVIVMVADTHVKPTEEVKMRLKAFIEMLA